MSHQPEQQQQWVATGVREALASGSASELLKALVEAFPGSWFFTRVDATFAFVNQNACDSLGYTRDELMALTLFDVDPALTPEIWTSLLAMGPYKPAAVRTQHRRKDGTVFPVEAFGSRIILGDENVSVSYVVDLSEETQTRRSLAEQQHLLQSVLDSAPVIVWFVDAEGRFQLSEGSALSLLGLTPGEAVGKTVAEVFPHLPALIDATARALSGSSVEGIVAVGGTEFEYRYHPRRDEQGRVMGATGVVIDVTARRRAERTNQRLTSAIEQTHEAILLLDREGRIEYANGALATVSGVPRAEALGGSWLGLLPEGEGDDPDGPAQAIARGSAWQGTIRRPRGMHDEPHTEQASLSPLRDATGNLTGFVAVSRDVTQQTRTEARLRQVEKLDAVGQLAGGVAHDFNNLLQVILGNAELCLALDDPEALRGALAEIRDAGRRAAALVGQLLAFSRKVGESKSVALAELLERILPLLRRLLGEHILIQLQIRGQALDVWGDDSQLEQVVVNLCVNARDAMPEGGRLDIVLGRSAVSLSEASRLGLPVAGDYVVVEVTDTGSGMSEAIQRRAFEPFFTTKAPGVGTGLGLATVYAVAKRHGGTIELRSQPGHGSTFRVFLRPSERPSEGPRPGAPAAPSQSPPLHILLAENDRSVRELLRRLLVETGHVVVAVRDGVEAIAMLDATGTPFDLLVLDAIMPRLNGADVYRALRAKSRTPVLFVSGHEFNALEALAPDPGWALLRKPFSSAELEAAVAALLAARGEAM